MTFAGLNLAALLALAAALSWTMAALFSHRPATELGSLHFNRLRMIAAVVIMAVMLLATGRPMAISGEFWPFIILSSLTGIMFGDFLLFAAMRRVGPRRTNVLFATNALFAAVFGWVFLGESLGGQTFLAILFGFGCCACGDLRETAGSHASMGSRDPAAVDRCDARAVRCRLPGSWCDLYTAGNGRRCRSCRGARWRGRLSGPLSSG